ncbi:MAG: elongation factor G [bacterium]|nr:elongation factor G [bacterium]
MTIKHEHCLQRWVCLSEKTEEGITTKRFDIDHLRNVAVVGHSGCGKTTLVESMLFNSGATDRLGKVAEGNTVSDYDPEEVKRHISINTTVEPVIWKDRKANVLDTPGYSDFIGEVKGALRVVEGALITVCAVSGVEVGTENAWALSADRGIARMFFINKMDRENADFAGVVSQLRNSLGNNVVPLQMPIGSEHDFKGVVDLLQMKAVTYTDGKNYSVADIPQELMDEAAANRDKVIELAAEGDDDLLMKYLEGEDLTADEVVYGMTRAIRAGNVFPVFCGSSATGVGIQTLMDALIELMPAPVAEAAGTSPKTGDSLETGADKLAALVYKTMADPYVGKLTYFRVFTGTLKSDSHVYNPLREHADERIGQAFYTVGKKQEPTDSVGAGDFGAVAKLQSTVTGDTLCDKDMPIVLPGISFPRPIMAAAVYPKTKGDEDKLGAALHRMMDEDPTLNVRRDTATAETILSGMGETHVDIAVDRLKRKFGVDVEVAIPKIPYRETVTARAKSEYKHKKQSGGRGQYGHCVIELEPAPRGEGFEFIDKIFGGSVPRQYIPAVEKGVRDAMQEGILAGYKVVDVKVTLVDGSFHPVDSSEMAFKIAGSMAFKKGFADARPVLLEPVMSVEVNVPDANTGDIISDLNTKRGRILGMEPQGNGRTVVKAMVPLGEMQRYNIDLTSITQGRGTFTMEEAHFEEVPAHTAERIIAEAAKEKKE